MTDVVPEGWSARPLPDLFVVNPPKPAANRLPADALVSFVPILCSR